ncbi:MAG: holo-[acyl-carrier-protein] synthase [Chloroflexi bacterium]|nr:holo-[acyl-carrier-protein] synthase [Chloroflexota bacterium]
MSQYIGIDIIEIGRIKEAVDSWGERFLKRVYTEAEMVAYGHKPASLAARFACKEAVMKLLGTGKYGINWREVETLSHPSGKPLVNLYGRARTKADELGIRDIAVSLSHSKEYAIAYVSAISKTNQSEEPGTHPGKTSQ